MCVCVCGACFTSEDRLSHLSDLAKVTQLLVKKEVEPTSACSSVHTLNHVPASV